MTKGIVEIQKGIFMVGGRLARNILVEPMASNTYLIDNNNELIIFDPSSGKETAEIVDIYIQERLKSGTKWKKAFLIVSHSHPDHAGNLHLLDNSGIDECHVLVHEQGFQNGAVKNEPVTFIKELIEECSRYYNPYLETPLPFNLFISPIALINAFSTSGARQVFGNIGGFIWPRPVLGAIRPESLKNEDLQHANNNFDFKCWQMGNAVVLPTPGHSVCSVSLYVPERKALFIGDAAWIGDPISPFASIRQCISSLETLMSLVKSTKIDLLFQGHGYPIEGFEQVQSCLDFSINRLALIRSQILEAYRLSGNDKDIRRLSKTLIREAPLFKLLYSANLPVMVLIVYNMVISCLRDEGILE
jgi:glyoxylase-like metal-dependent hydrolase (beta-lactamase superfamily II)